MHNSRKNYTVDEEHYTLPGVHVTQIKRIFLNYLENRRKHSEFMTGK